MSGLDTLTHTHTHTHTQDDYRNPRCACAPRVNNNIFSQSCHKAELFIDVCKLTNHYSPFLEANRTKDSEKPVM